MGWDSGRNLPVQNFVEYSPPPDYALSRKFWPWEDASL